jgi:hypothetical protein
MSARSEDRLDNGFNGAGQLSFHAGANLSVDEIEDKIASARRPRTRNTTAPGRPAQRLKTPDLPSVALCAMGRRFQRYSLGICGRMASAVRLDR